MIQQILRSPSGLTIEIGPFKTRIHSKIGTVAKGIELMYADFPHYEYRQNFTDFHVALNVPPGLRGWYRPQVHFYFDGYRPFKPLGLNQAYPFFEWGLNWCISNHAHHFLIIHAAVVEKCGLALILPGAPGAGKSTLCAGLVARGWRLLSDELTLIPSHDSTCIFPVPRPIGLKNESIDVMRQFYPDAVFGLVAHDTSKGTVSHIKPPKNSVERAKETAAPGFVIFPRYQAGSKSLLTERSKSSSYMEMARQSFNYNVLGETGFNRLTEIVSRCDCFDFQYSSLEDAIGIMDELVLSKAGAFSDEANHA